MKIGTYFAYWAKEWKVDYMEYIPKAAKAGFDVLEISTGITDLTDAQIKDLGKAAKDAGLILTAGFGIPADMDVSSPDPAVRRKGLNYLKKMFSCMDKCDCRVIGGNIYSTWPVDYTQPIDKAATRARSIASVREEADMAADYGITLGMEVLNRFEHFLLNTSQEACDYVDEVDRKNVKVMLDSFHMNIEEDSFEGAIKTAGSRLGHFHIGEANRKCPNAGGRIPWNEIAQALRDVNYQGYIVMEPFVRMGGGVGTDIRIWRDVSGGRTDAQIDQDIKDSCAFCKEVFHD